MFFLISIFHFPIKKLFSQFMTDMKFITHGDWKILTFFNYRLQLSISNFILFMVIKSINNQFTDLIIFLY